MQAVSSHVEPLERRQGEQASRQAAEVVHGKINMLQPRQRPELKVRERSTPELRLDQNQALLFRCTVTRHRFRHSPGLVAHLGPGSLPAPASPGSHTRLALPGQTGFCCSSAAAL